MMMLGKLPKVHDPRTLKLIKYVSPGALPAAPLSLDLTQGVGNWPMYANDTHGDCTCAAAAHMVEVWSLQIAGSPRIFTDPDILSLYALVNGGADNGADELTVLRTWREQGLAGEKIEAFCSLKPSDNYMNKLACWLFSGLYIGIELPLSARGADLWDVTDGPTGAPGSWGGHAVNIIGYDDVGLTCVTWGQIKKMTWRFWNKYVSESFCILPVEYNVLPIGGLKGVGVNFEQLRADLALVGATLT